MPSPAPLGPRALLTLRSPEGPEGAGGLALAPGAWPGHSQAGAPRAQLPRKGHPTRLASASSAVNSRNLSSRLTELP